MDEELIPLLVASQVPEEKCSRWVDVLTGVVVILIVAIAVLIFISITPSRPMSPTTHPSK